MLSTGFCCLSCRQRGLLEYESSNLIAIDVNCWLDVHVSNLHEPVGAGEERELITIFYSPQKIVIVIQHRCHHEEKTPKNRLTETLEPLKQNIGAPKLVSRYQIHSLSTLQLSGCCQLTLEAETK